MTEKTAYNRRLGYTDDLSRFQQPLDGLNSISKHSTRRRVCVLAGLLSLLVLVACNARSSVRLRNSLSNSIDRVWPANQNLACYPDPASKRIALLFGIMVAPHNRQVRDMLRWTYSQWQPFLNPSDVAEVVFVMCRSDDLREQAAIDAENAQFGDIFHVQGQESGIKVDQGKVYYYLESITAYAEQRNFDAIFKVDTDSFVNLPKVFNDFRLAMDSPDDLIYWGGVNLELGQGGGRPSNNYQWMLGECYGLSTALMRELFSSKFSYPRKHIATAREDELVGQWISFLPEQTFARIQFIDRFWQLADGPDYGQSPLVRNGIEWAQLPKNSRSPACGSPGDLRHDMYIIHQLKTPTQFQQIVDWQFKGTSIMPWLLEGAEL